LICWRCQTVNSDFAVFCSKCGSPLTRKPAGQKWKSPWLVVAASGLVLLGVAAILFVVLSRRPPAGGAPTPEPPAAEAAAETGPTLFVPGEVVVGDPAAFRMSRSAAAAIGAGWVATPAWALFGGTEIRFREEDGPDIPLEQGFWNEGAPVVLWKLTDALTGELSGFGPWKQDAPLLWRALAAGSAPLRVEAADPEPRGLYFSFTLPAEVMEAGVLFQAGRVVGWTFGEETVNGYLWAGPGEGDLAPALAAGQVFGFVAAAGREVGFFRALALGDEADAAERLSAFAQAFRSDPALRDEDLPARFRTAAIVGRMKALAEDLTRSGRARDVLRILDEGVLTAAADPELVKATVLAQARDQDYNRAIRYLDRLKKTVFDLGGVDASTVEPFRAQLYKDWLREILDKGGYFSVQVAYQEAEREFPDDPEIRILGVEVALAENNPEKARQLLRARDFPPLLKDRVDQLAARIKTQEDEQELVIPFNPAQNRIVLEARLNGTHRLRFLVDTGAMMSSIPSAAASALGIEVDQTAVRAVTTASGVILVYEVFLNSIDIMGYRVANMKVLLLDLPTDPSIGILGMDFLNNFRYEIDNQAGVFRLRKK